MNLTTPKFTTRLLKNSLIITTCTLLLAGCSSTPSSNPTPNSNAKIQVVAAENFWGEVAQAVGGDSVHVTSILSNPEVDPHSYEPTSDASKAVANSQIVIYTGIGYDGWMDKLLTSSSSNQTALNVGTDLLGKKEGDNPHIWYDPTTMPKLATRLAEDFAKLNPSQADTYRKRAQDYILSLAPLNQFIQKIKQTSTVPIAVSEPIYDYMASALNLHSEDAKFAKAIEDGNDPSPGDVATLMQDIKNKKIKLFIENIQTDSPTVKNITALAKENKIPVIQVTETEPKGKNYIEWMTDPLQQIATALGVQ